MEVFEKDYSQRTVLIVLVSALLFCVFLSSLIIFAINNPDESITESSLFYSKSTVSDYEQSKGSNSIDKPDNTLSAPDINVNADISDTTDKEIEHGWVINNLGYTYVYGDCGYQQFNYKTTAMERYINSINSFSELIPQKTSFYNVIVPVSSTFADIPSDIYKTDNFFNLSQSAFVSTVSSKTNEKVCNVPIVSLLEDAYDNGEYVYFRTDSNWTSLGAYKAYIAFCEQAGITPYSLDLFNSEYIGEFLGSFYNATASEAMYANPDKFICYSTVSDVSTVLTVYNNGIVYKDYTLCGNGNVSDYKYNAYLGREAGRYEISSNARGGSLLIIGDTSVHPILPFLASHYTTIDYINPQKYDKPIKELFSNKDYDSVITMCYSTNAVAGGYIPALNTITGETNYE